jgi:hypothetical protein
MRLDRLMHYRNRKLQRWARVLVLLQIVEQPSVEGTCVLGISRIGKGGAVVTEQFVGRLRSIAGSGCKHFAPLTLIISQSARISGLPPC